MLVMIAILLLLIIPLVMLILHLTRWKHASQWLIAVIGMLLVWPILFVTRFNLPQTISYIRWEPKTLFPISPTLLVDETSLTFAMALAAIGLALVLTAVARIEQAAPIPEPAPPTGLRSAAAMVTTANWQTWAGSLLIIGMGLVAVQSGNLLTVLLAWAILDAVELIILLAQVQDSPGRERAIISFSTRAVGIGVLVLAEIQIWRANGILSVSSISPRAAIYILLASGLRLGVLPLHLPFLQEVPLRRGLGTILRLIPAAASLSLLARAASVGLEDPAATYLLILSAFAAIFGAGLWAIAPDELSGRPFWLLGTAALATAAAIGGQPQASLAWGSTSLLVGGLLFFTSIRHPRLRILAIIGFLCLSGLPFTPNWNGVIFYTLQTGDMPIWALVIFYISFIAAHALLLAGYLRHALRIIPLAGDDSRDPRVERWIWLVYPLGLAVLPITHILTSLWMLPDFRALPIPAYFSGAAASALGVGIWYFASHLRSPQAARSLTMLNQAPSAFLTFSWVYQPVWLLYRLLQRLSVIVYTLLEGDGGILWAIVLFFFILMFIQR